MNGLIEFMKIAIEAHKRLLPIYWGRYTAMDWMFVLPIMVAYLCLFLTYVSGVWQFLLGSMAAMIVMLSAQIASKGR